MSAADRGALVGRIGFDRRGAATRRGLDGSLYRRLYRRLATSRRLSKSLRNTSVQGAVATSVPEPAIAEPVPPRELPPVDYAYAIGDRGTAEQLLHGEPHPGNMLSTKNGPPFIDLETSCRGPVEFDIAQVPDEVSEHYPGVPEYRLVDLRRELPPTGT